MAGYCSKFSYIFLVLVCVVPTIIHPSSASGDHEEKKMYIVYMGNLDETLSLQHIDILQDVVGSRSFARRSLVRSYTRSFNGFAAFLTAQEKQKLADHEQVVSVFPSITFRPQTTRSWDFMGLTDKVERNLKIESDLIIGVIDSGIWPESESFNDKGFGPPPKKWKGVCKGGMNFTCNNKIIGARAYNYKSPVNASARDIRGHGTHTASIASGNYVKDASFYGFAKGTARGGVPSSRIAAYNACINECESADLLAAFDDAIADGVDIITISIGGSASQFVDDPIAIGSFHAAQKGILVVQSAGNDRVLGSVGSVAPWIFSVAASSTDRRIISEVILGNGMILNGSSVNSFHLNGTRTTFPLIYGKNASRVCSEKSAQYCYDNCLDSELVKGKIVLCDCEEFPSDPISEAFRAGALGSIVYDCGYSDLSLVSPFPASALKEQNFSSAQNYVNSTKAPRGNILASETIRNLNFPRIASFSSKGPNPIIPDILKPDITAPGIDILAAYSPKASPSGDKNDKRSVNYNIESGTSMSCPHVAGAAAYVKSIHSDWSPSAIRSALMTTAWKMDPKNDPQAEFAYGSGHVDPVRAAQPGLLYETTQEDYVQFICGLGYDKTTIKKLFGGNTSCTSDGLKMKPYNLNYPSMTISIKNTTRDSTIAFSETLTRTVTNVGSSNATYEAITSKSSDYNITVNPSSLTFEAVSEKKSFEVGITGKISSGEIMISASLEWSDGIHNVRSPIVVYKYVDY